MYIAYRISSETHFQIIREILNLVFRFKGSLCMILFYDDWYKYPNAVIHSNTPNESFLRLSALYKKMGIKNHAFLLALFDTDLIGVDPFDPTLSTEIMVKIGIEANLNPWYFLREVIRVPAESGGEDIRFKANRSNISMWWLYLNHITNMVVQPRQTGKTFNIASLICYILDVKGRNTNQILLTKDDSLRASTLDLIRSIEESLPAYVLRRTKNDISNTSEIKVSALMNSIIGLLSSVSEKAASKVGRGHTVANFFIDEIAYISNIMVALRSLLGAGGAARDRAKANKAIYSTLLATTAGKIDDKDGGYAYELLMESMPWNEKLFDCKDEDNLVDTIKKSNNNIVRINSTFNHRQLGYTDSWLLSKIQEASSKGEDAERDFLNKWTNGNASSPFTKEQLAMINESLKDPVYNDLTENNYLIHYYVDDFESILMNEPTVMGLDTSDALGGNNDNIGLIIRSVYSGEVIASAKINETNLIDFMIMLTNFIVRYDKMIVIIERRSSGPAIVDYLLKVLPNYNVDPYKRLFNRVINDRDNDIEKFKIASGPLYQKSIDMLTHDKKHFGFATSASGLTSRSELYGAVLVDAVKKTGSGIKDSSLINELNGLIIKNGRVDHGTNQHDDLVIAWLLTYWLLSRGENLSVYGIDPTLVLHKNKHVNVDQVGQYDLKKNEEIKQEISRLLEELKNTNDSNLMQMYEKQIQYLKNRLVNVPNTIFASIDEALNKVKEEKRDTITRNRNSYGSIFDQRQQYGYTQSSYLFGDQYNKRF